jgi:hypothetical protein
MVTPAKYGEEEYILEFDGQEHLIEVKGVSKSITLGHLRQLNERATQWQISLVSSTSFFAAFSAYLSDTFQGKALLQCLTSANGVADFAGERNGKKDI